MLYLLTFLKCQLILFNTGLDCFTTHVGEHRTVHGLWKRQGIPCLSKIPTVHTHSATVPRRGNAFCLRHVGDTRHVGDGAVFPMYIWIRNNWVGTSQLDACQPEAVYRPMCGASSGVEQNNTGLILGLQLANERCRYKVTSSLIAWAQT